MPRPAVNFTAARGPEPSLLPRALSLCLFACGFFAWIFKPRFDGGLGPPIIPYSPLQIGFPLLGLLGFGYMLLAYRTAVFRITEPTLSAALLKAGACLVAAGAVVHVIISPDRLEALLFIIRWLLPLCFLAFLIPVRLTGVSPLPLLYGIAAGALFSTVCVEAYRAGLSVPVTQTTLGRFGAFLNHPNQYGIVLATSSPVIVYFATRRGAAFRVLALATLGVYCLGLFQAQSKTNLVLFLVALALSAFMLALHDRRKLAATLIATPIALVLLIFVGVAGFGMLQELAPNDAKIIEDALFDPTGARSVDDRRALWEQAFTTIRQHPLFGVGPGQAEEYLPLPHAHNLFLQLYLDAGASGVLGIALVVLSVLCRNAEAVFEARALRGAPDEETKLRLLGSVAVLIYVLGNSMSDSFNTATMSTFVLFAGLAYGHRPAPRAVAREPLHLSLPCARSAS